MSRRRRTTERAPGRSVRMLARCTPPPKADSAVASSRFQHVPALGPPTATRRNAIPPTSDSERSSCQRRSDRSSPVRSPHPSTHRTRTGWPPRGRGRRRPAASRARTTTISCDCHEPPGRIAQQSPAEPASLEPRPRRTHRPKLANESPRQLSVGAASSPRRSDCGLGTDRHLRSGALPPGSSIRSSYSSPYRREFVRRTRVSARSNAADRVVVRA